MVVVDFTGFVGDRVNNTVDIPPAAFKLEDGKFTISTGVMGVGIGDVDAVLVGVDGCDY